MIVRNIRFITPLLLICIAHIEAGAQRIVCDDTCKLADAATVQTVGNQGPEYAVVSPVGQSAVEMIGQAPRLETLDGKTIAVVGVSFMTHVTHPEIKRLIKEHYPSADVILLDEIGFAGPYPAPGVTRRAKEEFQARLKAMGLMQSSQEMEVVDYVPRKRWAPALLPSTWGYLLS